MSSDRFLLDGRQKAVWLRESDLCNGQCGEGDGSLGEHGDGCEKG